jgi:hypothetical protein
LDFADAYNDIGDRYKKSLPDSSQKDVTLFYLVNESGNVPVPMLEHFMDTDRFVQQQIQRRYYSLRISFYRKSSSTEEMLRRRTYKALTLCDDDLIADYEWDEGRPLDTIFYKNGKMKGPDKIKLEENKEQ